MAYFLPTSHVLTAGEEDDVLQAGGLDQVRQHRVPGVHGRTGRGVPRAGDDDTDAGLRLGLFFAGLLGSIAHLNFSVMPQEKQHKKKCLLPDDSVPRSGRLVVQGRGEQRQGRRVKLYIAPSKIILCRFYSYFGA